MFDGLTHKDLLTPGARDVVRAAAHGGYTALVVRGSGSADGKRLLQGLNASRVLTAPVTNASAADALLAGLWLLHDWLDESHQISQAIETKTGSAWHAILHRREGDFWNSKYWYARCANHPAWPVIAERVKPMLAELSPARSAALTRGGWNPDALVDLAEHAEKSVPGDLERPLAVTLQEYEWLALFDATIEEAIG